MASLFLRHTDGGHLPPRTSRAVRRGSRFLEAGALAVIVSVLATLTLVTGSNAAAPRAQAAAAAPVCGPAQPIYVNTGGQGANNTLRSYSQTGIQLSSVVLAATIDYGDIAFDATGKLYGIGFFAPTSRLDTINPSTGAVTATVTITGPAAIGTGYNALSALPNGNLLTAITGVNGGEVYEINPATGASTVFTTLPADYSSAGDFLSLPDGDVLAALFGPTSGVTSLVRLHADGTSDDVGVLPGAYFGAAQADGQIYLARSNGDLIRVAAIPTDADPTRALTFTTIASTGLPLYGATSLGDTGGCAPTLTVTKALGTSRNSDTDQFTVQIHASSPTGNVVNDTANSTTTGSGQTVTAGSGTTGLYAAAARTTYYIGEAASGTTVAADYTSTLTCTDANGVQTGLPTQVSAATPVAVTPQPGAAIECLITNTAVPAPAITIVKTADRTSITAAGQVINYRFLVTNTGNVTLTNATVNETTFTGTGTPPVITCPANAASLAPGAQVTCTASYTVTQADVENGGVRNAARATGTPPSGPPTQSPPDEVTVPSTPSPAITIKKSADPARGGKVGDSITYSFLITNTGNVTLKNVRPVESAFSGTGKRSAITCPAAAATLAPRAQVTCTATYALTQADVNAGVVTNTATATGTPPTGPPVESPPSKTTVTIPPAPGITVFKTADPAQVGKVGDRITYSFLITNTGNVTLSNVRPVEGDFSGTGKLSAISCPAAAASLAPGATVTCTATYVLTQADVKAGEVTNTATATGTPPGTTTPPTSPPSKTTTPVVPPKPALTVVKSVSPAASGRVGDTITYSFLITNTGNVTLKDVRPVEGEFSGTGKLSVITCPAGAASLAPGAKVTCTATYVLTQADVAAGVVTNTATATGTPPGGPIVESPPSRTRLVPNPPVPVPPTTPTQPTPTTIPVPPNPGGGINSGNGTLLTAASSGTNTAPIGILLLVLVAGASVYLVNQRRRRTR